MPNHDDMESLIAQLRSFQTRAHARQRLHALGEAAVPGLLGLVEDPQEHENARWAAITLLGNLKCELAVPVLVNILRDELSLRGQARKALELITGQDAGEDADAWETLMAGSTADAGVDGASTPASSDDADELDLCRQAVGDIATHLTWEETDGDGYAYIRLPLKDDRKQQMIVTFDEIDEDGRALATIYTECGPATPEAVEASSRRNVTQRYGKFLVEEDPDGQRKVVMRHQMSCPGLLPGTLRTILLNMAREADGLEFEITQSDRI